MLKNIVLKYVVTVMLATAIPSVMFATSFNDAAQLYLSVGITAIYALAVNALQFLMLAKAKGLLKYVQVFAATFMGPLVFIVWISASTSYMPEHLIVVAAALANCAMGGLLFFQGLAAAWVKNKKGTP